MNGLRGATGFLTRIPVGATTFADGDADAAIASAVPWFPVVGALVGIAVGLVYWAGALVLPTSTAAALAIAGSMILTGAFHEDGLADSADALWGGYERDRRLAILKDSRHGTFGVSALVVSIIVRVSALAALTPGWTSVGALLGANAIGRGAAVALMGTSTPARVDGLGASYVRALRPRHIVAGAVAAVALGLVGLGGWVVPALALAALAALATRALTNAKLGGIVGDVLGALEQVVELAVLVLAAAIVHEHDRRLGWWPR